MTLVFLLEEKSMKYFLDGILPKILPEGIEYITIPHEGKTDLQKSIPIKLRAWNKPDTKFVIVQDQDSNDCRELKQKLVDLCAPYHKEVLIRIKILIRFGIKRCIVYQTRWTIQRECCKNCCRNISR